MAYLCSHINPRPSLFSTTDTTDNNSSYLPTLLRYRSPPQPSCLHKKYPFRLTCTQSSCSTNPGADESVATSSSLTDHWIPITLTKNLDPNRPTRVYLLNRGIVIRVEHVYNKWVAVLHEGADHDTLPFDDCRSPYGPRFPVKEFNGVLFLWPDDDGWEQARNTKLPNVKSADIMSPKDDLIVISEVPVTNSKGHQMNDRSIDVLKPCCPFTETSAKSSSDIKSTKEASMNNKPTNEALRAFVSLIVNGVLLFFFLGALYLLFQNKEIIHLFQKICKERMQLFADFLKEYFIKKIKSWGESCLSTLIEEYLVTPILTGFAMKLSFAAVKDILKKKDDESTTK